MNTTKELEIKKDRYGSDYVESVPLRTIVAWLEDEKNEFYSYHTRLGDDKNGFMRLSLKGRIEKKNLEIYTEYFPEQECFKTYDHLDVYGISLDDDYKANRLALAKDIITKVFGEEYIRPKWKEEEKEARKATAMELTYNGKKITLCKGGK